MKESATSSQQRRCECGASLEGAHPNRKRCPSCAAARPKALDRINKGRVLAPDAVVCPICGERMNTITAGHYRTHGFKDAASFKKATGLTSLKAPSLCERQSQFVRSNNPTRGRKRTPAEVARMSAARKGKGVGVAGKYERTPEIRAKISAGVTAFLEDHPDGYANRFFKSGWVYCHKADRDVWVRSSWEKRVLRVLDQYDEIETVEVEPFRIPYTLDGVGRQYTPDLLVVFEGNIREVWEIKPQCYTDTSKNRAKFQAAQGFCDRLGAHFRVVTEKEIGRMEQRTALMIACKGMGVRVPGLT